MFESLKTPRFKVQSPFLQQLQGRIGKAGFRLLLLLVPLFFLRACLITYVPPNMVGVRQISYGPNKGLQKRPVDFGYQWQIAGYETVHTFPRDIQVVEFTNSSSESSELHRQMPAINVPTVDGYPVDVDVSVLYRLKDPYKVASKFGFGKGYEESVVIRFTDFLVKRYLGDLRAEQFYHEARLDKVRALKADLAQRLEPNGLVLTDVVIRQYDYPQTFQTLTEQKKIQDQKVLANRELAKQEEVQTRLNQTIAEGQNLINVKTAEFNAQITEINARKDLYERQKHAEGDLLIKSAEANGTEQINRALEGAGSAKLLKLRRGLALLNSIKGPIYISEDPTDLGKISSDKPEKKQ
ncbi:MAG TPA: SPFH domain-containing protein [Thermoanaerobaculia bacterium]|jgi:regulator of protease activity HflC (stomatin/prohibitin superfamily)